MVRVKFHRKSSGAVPSEVVVQIMTVQGPEDVIVHSSQVDDQAIEAGFIGKEGDKLLVELPRETVSGRWRVWVPDDALA